MTSINRAGGAPMGRVGPRARRLVLSSYATNGLSAAFGMLLIGGAVHLFLGPFAAAASSVGIVVVIPPDQPAPRRGKFWQLLPAALIGPPLFFGVQSLRAAPVGLALLLVPATFVAFLGAAWGKRGLPIAVSVMFAMIFSMAVRAPPDSGAAWSTTLYFTLGAGLYVIYATIANAALNARYRVLTLAECMLSLAKLMRTQAGRFLAGGDEDRQPPLIGQLLSEQSALTGQLQNARDILLESPRTPNRQWLAGMLMQVLEMRDHLVACQLDLETLQSHHRQAPMLSELSQVLATLAGHIERAADALLVARRPSLFASHRPRIAGLRWPDEGGPAADNAAASPAMLARGLANRVGNLDDETLRLVRLARHEAEPDLAVVRAAWQMFVSPTAWSWRPLRGLHWEAPPLRHAIRAALAVAVGDAISLMLPWGTHDYWILLTIVVVLRGSFAQTVERRNTRVAGTVLGCVLAGALLAVRAPPTLLAAVVVLAQGVAHAFAARRYLVSAVAATVLALVQAHLLNAAASPAFDAIERIADTLIGVSLAWGFSYVLPSWQRGQIPALVGRSLAAQARHACVALGLGQLQAVDNQPELEWRLARREAYDSLSALVQATQHSLAEPRAVHPPLEPLGRLLAHSYELLAQLTAIKSMLLLRRGRLQQDQIQAPLRRSAEIIEARLTGRELPVPSPPLPAAAGPVSLPDPFDSDLSPWLLRRLDLAAAIAGQLREDAKLVQPVV